MVGTICGQSVPQSCWTWFGMNVVDVHVVVVTVAVIVVVEAQRDCSRGRGSNVFGWPTIVGRATLSTLYER